MKRYIMKLNKSLFFGICLALTNICVLKGQPLILNKRPLEEIDTTLEKIILMVKNISSNGWKLYDEIEKFEPANLYDKIDGRAEYYISYDLVWAIFGSFRNSTDNHFSIELSIFNMLNPTNAFGAFSGERSIGASQLKFGRESYYSEPNYYIWSGQYYIQISASDRDDELNRVCLELAEKLTKDLYDSGQPVWGLNALPVNNLVPQSVQYFLVDALGHIFLKDTYTAKYYFENIEVPVFLSHQNSYESGGIVLSKFKEFADKHGKGNESISRNGIEILVCDMGKYYDIIFQKGLIVAGVTGLSDKNLAISAAADFWKQLQIE
jgi:hypothetical protein